jgi:hypothetical protein
MYETRKSWPLEKIAVELWHDNAAAVDGVGKVDRFEPVLVLSACRIDSGDHFAATNVGPF